MPNPGDIIQVMTKFKVDEISSVNRPAQGPALAVIMKRSAIAEGVADANKETALTKSGDLVDILTSSTKGHQHGITINSDDGNVYVHVNYASEKDSQTSHDHVLAVTPEGITVSENEGHSHTIDADVLQTLLLNRMVEKSIQKTRIIGFTNAADNGGLIAKETTMPIPQEEHDKVVKQLAVQTAINSLSVMTKGHYDTLTTQAAKDSYLAKSETERTLDVELAKSADPVVYTTDSGQVFLKSDDNRMVVMAKQHDVAMRQLATTTEANQALTFGKRAQTELSHLPGDEAGKTALLKAVSGIEDETIRKSVEATLKGADSNSAYAFKTYGNEGQDNEIAKSANEQLDTVIAKRADTDGISEAAATELVMQTREGQTLYNKANQR